MINRAPELDPRTASQALRCLAVCGYRDDLIQGDFPMPSGSKGLIGFAHRPFDARSACIAVLPSTAGQPADIRGCRETGASLVFLPGEKEWEVWMQKRAEPQMWRTVASSQIEDFFVRHREDFAPGMIFRAKTWQRAGVGRQLDFVDAGLLPMLEHEEGGRLLELFERMVAVSLNRLGWRDVPDVDDEAHWLTQANFWLLAAKLFQDKRVSGFINLDLKDVRTVFQRVGAHYNKDRPDPPRINGRLPALQEAAKIAADSPDFRNLSAEALGMLYEQALISPTTRKLLGTHRTPTYLADYMLARLSGWIEELGWNRCRVFEPGCGHAPFLTGALRLLSDRLPANVASDQQLRHRYLRDHLRGCDNDPFALEIARLCLTLADIPNENGWVLEPEDMFANDFLERETSAASVVLANPPFERERAATFLRRMVDALRPGTIFGVVLPVNELAGSASDAARRKLLADCEIKEISVFPDRMFKFASVETGVLLGRKHEAESGAVAGGILFRRVRPAQMGAFRERYEDSWCEKVDADWLASENEGRFLVPDLHRVWDGCRQFPTLQEFADVGQGFSHRSPHDPLFPKGAITKSNRKEAGFVEGFANMDDAPDTHLQPPLWWLNMAKATIARPRAGTTTGIPQVLMNYAPAGPGEAWRLKAFRDPVGRPAMSRMLLLRPKQANLPLACLWAVCNSPAANAYVFGAASKRDIPAGLIRQMPVPDFNACDLSKLKAAARAYLDSAVAFTKTIPHPPVIRPPAIKNAKGHKSSGSGQMRLGFAGEAELDRITVTRDRLRAMHWRVDAEVLRLYALPPALERELLDTFDGVRRIGVPFEQTRYIPREFRDVLTLDEFLRITDEWDATETRRCKLIEKRIKTGSRTTEEEAEFQQLQRLLMLHRRYFSPLPMLDTEKLKALLAEDQAAGTND